MPPSNKTPASSTENKDVKFILSAIASADTFTPTWQTVANEHGITYGRNAAKKFRDLVKSRGYKFEDGKLTLSEENSDEDDKAGVAGDGAARKTSKKAVKGEVVKCTPKKRKIKKESVDDDEDDK